MTAGQTRLEARIWAKPPNLGGPLSAPFILAPGEQHAGAPPLGLHTPFIRIASRHTDGLIGLGEVQLPPFRASGRWTGW